MLAEDSPVVSYSHLVFLQRSTSGQTRIIPSLVVLDIARHTVLLRNAVALRRLLDLGQQHDLEGSMPLPAGGIFCRHGLASAERGMTGSDQPCPSVTVFSICDELVHLLVSKAKTYHVHPVDSTKSIARR